MAKFSIGQKVEVLPTGDETLNELLIGERGRIVQIDSRSDWPVGETHADPFYVVLFKDGQRDMFWGEELKPCEGARHADHQVR